MTTRQRPLSPHLSVYRLTLTMLTSIVHRITGGAMYVGTILLVGWLAAAAIGEGALETVQAIFGHWLGQIVLFGYTWALFQHMLGGLRYFTWDTGNGLDHPTRERLAQANIIGSVLLTLIVWSVFVWFR